MSILVNKQTRLVVQGITGREGAFHTQRMRDYGTAVVAGVTPGKGGTDKDGVPVFDSVAEARERTGANTSVIFVPPSAAADGIMEAADAGIGVIVCITEGIPVQDMVRAAAFVQAKGSVLVGPNCPGLLSPGQAKVGIMPVKIARPGHIGVVSRSGTLTYEAVAQLTSNGFGQSTCLGIGGDPVIGQTFTDILRRFDADPETEAVVLIGEIGGTAEQEAAEYVRDHSRKPVFAFIAGRTAPAGKRMGHAGAIVSGRNETTEEKLAFLASCGIVCVDSLTEIGSTVRRTLGQGR